MPVCLKPRQSFNLPRPFVDAFYDPETILRDGLMIEVAPEGKPMLPRKLCRVLCYSNEK